MLLKRVAAYIRQHALLEPGMPLAVGVSGGPDSVALLHLLTRIRAGGALKLIAAHLDHGLRPDSGRDAEFVARTAAAWGVDCVVERVDVAALGRSGHLSVEEAGRKARYEFFARLTPAVAVAHTADDQVETVLMHFLRGSGLTGLRGMRPLSRQLSAAGGQLTVIRPLLFVSRSEIEAYLAAHRLEYVVDATNADTTFFRNRLRHELVPFLEGYNPNIRETVRRAAEALAGDDELLQDLIEKAWDETTISCVMPGPHEAIGFSLPRWRALPLALQRALLRQAVHRLRPGLRDADFNPIDHAVRWSQTAPSGHTADVLGGLCLSVVGEELRVGRWPDRSRSGQKAAGTGQEAHVILTLPGETTFSDYHFTATVLDSVSLAEIESNPDPWTAYLEAGLSPFSLRTRRPGDRFQPLGMRGTMKLSDLMINSKIPVDRRDTWPLVCCGENAETVLWVAGLRLSERAKAGQEMRQGVRVVVSGLPFGHNGHLPHRRCG